MITKSNFLMTLVCAVFEIIKKNKRDEKPCVRLMSVSQSYTHTAPK